MAKHRKITTSSDHFENIEEKISKNSQKAQIWAT